jgi:ribose-phosphate pyrophosphokinase
MDNAILMADPNSHAWQFAEKIRDYIQSNEDAQIPLEEITIGHFRNKEPKIHIPKNIRKKEVYFIADSSLNPADWLTQIILVEDVLLNSSASGINLILPDFLFARQDRKTKSREPISARAVMRAITPYAKSLTTMDLHAAQIEGFADPHCPVNNLHSFPALVNYVNSNNNFDLKNLVVISPDAGGVKRATAFAKKMGNNLPVNFIYKSRGKNGDVESMNLAGNVNGKDVLIIDDMIDSGGTQYNAAKLLKEHGAQKLYCYGTHGLFTEGISKLESSFEFILVSNTHYQKEQSDKLYVMDVSPTFAKAIYSIHKGKSLSDLFS